VRARVSKPCGEIQVCVGRISKQKESQHRIRHLEQEIIQRADGGICRVSEHYARKHTTCNSPKFYKPSTLRMWWRTYQRTLTKNLKDSLITTNPGRRDAMTSVHKLAVVLKLAWRQRDTKERTCSLLQDRMINHTNDNWQGCGRKWSLCNKSSKFIFLEITEVKTSPTTWRLQHGTHPRAHVRA